MLAGIKKSAVIFDMDGVLFDTESFYYNRRKDFLNDRGITIDHLPPAFFIGGNMKQVWQAILGDDYVKWDVKMLQNDYNAYKASHPLPYQELIFPDVKEVLKALKERHISMAVASSSTMADIQLALSVTGLTNYFDFMLSGDDFLESKPDPAIYLEATRRLELPKEEVIVVEDSTKGIQAGISAGLEVLAIRDERFGLDQSLATEKITNLKDLLSKLG